MFVTRSTSCLSDHSRCGVPTAPRKYLVVTMFAALTDQESGNSTPCCSKLTLPSRQLVITTSRRSHVTWSYGCTPTVVWMRRIFRPVPLRLPLWDGAPLLTVSVIAPLPLPLALRLVVCTRRLGVAIPKHRNFLL